MKCARIARDRQPVESGLRDTLRLREHFDDIHYAAALGCSKPDAAFFKAFVSFANTRVTGS
jgi:FMN phosphatase YigB (HAD superfamily)